MRTIKDIDIDNKMVIIRCDFNVPIKDGRIIDDNRIKMSIPTINYCLEKNCKIILLSHLGRIKDEKDLEKNSLEPVAKKLQEILNKKVNFISQTRGKEVEEAINNLNSQEIIMLQNTRYEDLIGKKESSNDEELSKYWANLGDVFINDAFGTIHRSHASNVGIATYLPSAIGFLVEKELNALSSLNNPQKPFIVILGGSKVKDKIGVIKNLVKISDKILIGGGMAFTFLKAQNYEIGKSILDEESIEFCQDILRKYPDKIVLPVDVSITTEYSNETPSVNKDIEAVSQNEMGLDIGPKTTAIFKDVLKTANTVLWNGPLGVYEFSKYKKSTDSILNYLVDNNIKTILGGGDIVAAATNANLKDKVYHASTGGGATLEYLEGKKLPGLEIIK